jgi:hypothetical protein
MSAGLLSASADNIPSVLRRKSDPPDVVGGSYEETIARAKKGIVSSEKGQKKPRCLMLGHWVRLPSFLDVGVVLLVADR